MAIRSEVLTQGYTVECELGLWEFGTVQVLKERKSGAKKTCKTVKKALISRLDDVVARITQLRKLSHPHVCSISDFLEDRDHLFIVSDRYNGGDMQDWSDQLVDELSWLEEETCAAYLAQALVALAYCHAKHVYHHELRPSNILLTSQKPDAAVVVSDFGLNNIFAAALSNNLVALKMPSPYDAPELSSESEQVIDGAPDVWSIGAIAQLLLVGQGPSCGSTWSISERSCQLGRGDDEAWAERSAASRDFVRRLQQPVDRRPTAARALQHPWLRGVIIPKVLPRGMGYDATQDIQQKMFCYTLAVLLAPALVSHHDLRQLRRKFAWADRDQDGFIAKSAASELLQDTAACEEAMMAHCPGSDLQADAALEIVDVRGTGTFDLCSAICAALLARVLRPTPSRGYTAALPPPVGASRAAEPLPRLLELFFEVYSDRQAPLVSTKELGRRLRTAAGLDMEKHADVSFDEVLAVFPPDRDLDRHLLVAGLSSGAGRGTPLALGCCETPTLQETGRCWEPSLDMRGFDGIVRGGGLLCGSCSTVAGAEVRGRSGHSRWEPSLKVGCL